MAWRVVVRTFWTRDGKFADSITSAVPFSRNDFGQVALIHNLSITIPYSIVRYWPKGVDGLWLER